MEVLIRPFFFTVNVCPTLSPNVGILPLQDTPRSSRKGLQSCVNLGDEGGFGAGSPLKGSFPRRPAKELAQVRQACEILRNLLLFLFPHLRFRSRQWELKTKTQTSGHQIYVQGLASGICLHFWNQTIIKPCESYYKTSELNWHLLQGQAWLQTACRDPRRFWKQEAQCELNSWKSKLNVNWTFEIKTVKLSTLACESNLVQLHLLEWRTICESFPIDESPLLNMGNTHHIFVHWCVLPLTYLDAHFSTISPSTLQVFLFLVNQYLSFSTDCPNTMYIEVDFFHFQPNFSVNGLRSSLIFCDRNMNKFPWYLYLPPI